MKKIINILYVILLLQLVFFSACMGSRDNPLDPKGTNFKDDNDIPGPLFDPPAGLLAGEQTIEFYSEIEGALIKFTTDDSDPLSSETAKIGRYTKISSETILKAVSIFPDGTNSSVSSAEYTVQILVLFDLFNGKVIGASADVNIITSPEGGSVLYTIDGSDPIANGTDGSILTINSDITVKAFASMEGCVNSEVVESLYSFPGWTTIAQAVTAAGEGDTINELNNRTLLYACESLKCLLIDIETHQLK